MSNITLPKARIFWAILFSALLLVACSDTTEYQKDKHYSEFSNIIDDVIANHPELNETQVLEFFTYGCSHCKTFAPLLKKWGVAKESNIKYVPVVWNDVTDLHARAYYLIENHENFNDLHSGLFELVADFSRTDSMDDQKIKMITWFQEQSIQPIDALNAFNSTVFEQELALSVLLSKRFQVTGTPTMVVNNTYRINNKALTSQKDLLNVAEKIMSK